jgi:hypothetical protein
MSAEYLHLQNIESGPIFLFDALTLKLIYLNFFMLKLH